MAEDWVMQTKETIWYVGGIIKSVLSYPLRLFSGLPDWVKAIVYIALLLLALFIAWRVYVNRDKWRFIDPE